MIIDNGRLHIVTSSPSLDEYGATVAADGGEVVVPCQYEQQSQNYGARVEGVNYVASTYLMLIEGDLSAEASEATELRLEDAKGGEVKSGSAVSVEYLFAVGLTRIIL